MLRASNPDSVMRPGRPGSNQRPAASLLVSILLVSRLLLSQAKPTGGSMALPTSYSAPKRRDDSTTTTYQPTTTIVSGSISVAAGLPITTTLQPGTSPIPLAATMGLIMPNPWQEVYTGLEYELGFVDPVAKPAPTVGGWLRQIRPLLIFPDYSVNAFPPSGQLSPYDEGSIPEGGGGLCGTTVDDWSTSYPFVFAKSGWYMLVINQTWIQTTIYSNDTCQFPLLAERTFYSWQSLSVAPLPTTSPSPPSPTTAFTVYNPVEVSAPPALPFREQPSASDERLALGLGVTAALTAIAGAIALMWFIRRRQIRKRETLAFSRLSAADKASFLADNPESWLNPDRRPTRRQRGSVQSAPGSAGENDLYWQQVWNRQHASSRWAPNFNGGRWGTNPFSRYPQGGMGGNMQPMQMGMGYQGVPVQPHMGQVSGW